MPKLPRTVKTTTPIPTSFQTPLAKQAAWWLLKGERELKEVEQRFVEELLNRCPEIKAVKEQARAFRDIVKGGEEAKFAAWLDTTKRGMNREMVGFALGLSRDDESVIGALRYQWSNGQTEGQVNRLKFLKRQMYGRAKLDLLRARVLHKV